MTLLDTFTAGFPVQDSRMSRCTARQQQRFLRPTAAVAAALCLGLAGCNSIATRDESTLTIEHTALRSREAVYTSALHACQRQGKQQAVFQQQVNKDPDAKPATGMQLSTFACR